MKPTQTKPSIVFCHGIWADGSCFNKVIPTLQAEGFEDFLEIGGAFGFGKFGGRNFAEGDLLLGDPRGVFVDPGEGLGAGGIVRDFLDGVSGGARRNGGHHKNDTADMEEFHGFRGFDFSAECGGRRGRFGGW